MRLHPAINSSERKVLPFRSATMSTQIVAQVRDALFARELRPGDFLGTEKDLGRPLRGQPHRRPRCAANARSPGRGRHQGRVRRRRAHRPGQCPPVRRGAGGAARSCRRLDERDHGCAARHRVPRGRTRRRQLHRRGPRAAARAHRRCGRQDRRRRRLYPLIARIPSRGRRGVAQPRPGRAADLAAACVMAGAEPDADFQSGTPHSRRSTRSWPPSSKSATPPAHAG